MEDLIYEKKNGFKSYDEAKLKKVNEYAKDYMSFISNYKIDREVVKFAANEAKKIGFKEATLDSSVKVGDKLYFINKNKCIALVKIGNADKNAGVKIVVAHMDSPRLDLKQNPLYEEKGTAFFKTHYYGGIKKYQWLTIPLAMHGAVILNNGKTIDFEIGEKEDDPVFYISDLLPHLSHELDTKKICDSFEAEKLNIICGGVPAKDIDKDAVKYNVLKMLNEKYGIKERDFLSAEIEFVPANKAREIGFDRAYIGAYGHDDKCCAYTSLSAFLESNDKNNTILYLVDKEEIGSEGISGAQSSFLMDVFNIVAKVQSDNVAYVRQQSKCISADVTSAYDTNFKDVFEANNTSYLSCGVSINKYTGARGKSGSSDASAEYTSYITNLFDSNNLLYQTGEIGKVDCGGGGTVAKYLANKNIDTIDIGIPVMSMHSPFELISKVDLYSAYEVYKAFFNDKD